MMEEVGDDTNGESTFEFVGEKDAILYSPPSTSTTVENPPPTISSPSQAIAPGLFTQSVQSLDKYQSLISSGNSEQPVIPFFDPAQHMSPKEMILPPLTNPQPSTSSFQNPYASQGYSPQAETFTVPQQPQEMYKSHSDPHVQHSSFALPMDNNPSMTTSQSNAGTGVWGWIKGTEFLNKVAEKAKNSVDTMITTLDPGMKEIINSGGDINIIVASGSEIKVSAVREAFQQVFGKATVQGISVQSSSIAPQPVGYSAGLKAAEERIINLRQQGLVHNQQVMLAIENFLVELTPENWFDVGCLLLQDFSSGTSLQVYTQAIPISSHYVMQAKDQTPSNYPLGWSGFAVTIGQILGPSLGVHHSEWHEGLTGVSRREMLNLAAKTIAGLYKAQLRR